MAWVDAVQEDGRVTSMKVPPKRKGNLIARRGHMHVSHDLNESPSEKEGKSEGVTTGGLILVPQ